MAVHWWEWWSPGLQAAGGIAELIGLILLVREWQRALEQAAFAIEYDLESVDETNPALPDDPANPFNELERRTVRQRLQHLQSVDEHAALQDRKIWYMWGVGIIMIGIVLQVVANVLAWLGARGWFGA